jgi:quinol monooxygenase YgiN
MKYGLHGKLTAKAGESERLASILVQASKLMEDAPGCHLYMVSRDIEDPESVWITEAWDSKEHHDNSLKVDGVSELISEAMPLLQGRPEGGQKLEILIGI